MDKAHVGTIPTNLVISEHKEKHIPKSYRDTIRTHCMQRRHQGRICKNKNYPRLKPPVNPKQVRVLLGHTGYYRKFMRYHSNMTYRLEELLREDREFDWIDECNISFQTLKGKIVEAPILRFPNWSIKFHVHINASGLALGMILTVPGDDGMDYPIVYSSKKLNKAEINYSTTEREALGMVFAL